MPLRRNDEAMVLGREIHFTPSAYFIEIQIFGFRVRKPESDRGASEPIRRGCQPVFTKQRLPIGLECAGL